METSLHRELKAIYAGEAGQTEMRVGRYRIDAVADGELVEIQHGRLSALRSKLGDLLTHHRVRVVKPIVGEKLLIRQRSAGGRVVSRRRSPKRGGMLDLFHDLVYFTRIFPHPGLSIEAILVDVEEYRYPGHGRRRRWRKNDFQVDDQRLVQIRDRRLLQVPADLVDLLRHEATGPFEALPVQFHSGDLARAIGIDRWVAQRVAYCLRECGASNVVGKQRNAVLYELAKPKRRKRPRVA